MCLQLKRELVCLVARLPKGGFLAGDSFTFADINVMPILGYLEEFPESGAAIAAAKSLSTYFDRLAARPSFQKTAPAPRPQAKAS